MTEPAPDDLAVAFALAGTLAAESTRHLAEAARHASAAATALAHLLRAHHRRTRHERTQPA